MNLLESHSCFWAQLKCHLLWEVFPDLVLSWKVNGSPSVFSRQRSESEVTQSFPTLCDPTDCRQPGSSVHGILLARVLEWVSISFSRGSSQPRDRTCVSHIAGRCFTSEPLGKPLSLSLSLSPSYQGGFQTWLCTRINWEALKKILKPQPYLILYTRIYEGKFCAFIVFEIWSLVLRIW